MLPVKAHFLLIMTYIYGLMIVARHDMCSQALIHHPITPIGYIIVIITTQLAGITAIILVFLAFYQGLFLLKDKSGLVVTQKRKWLLVML